MVGLINEEQYFIFFHENTFAIFSQIFKIVGHTKKKKNQLKCVPNFFFFIFYQNYLTNTWDSPRSLMFVASKGLKGGNPAVERPPPLNGLNRG